MPYTRVLYRQQYDVIVVSPRNYFLYTPLLPAVATGTCEERSIVEPVRKILNGKGRYYEASCQVPTSRLGAYIMHSFPQDINPDERTIVACFPKDAGFPEACFKVEYDYLVVAVGSVNNTFNIAGVKVAACADRACCSYDASQEHAMFFKSIDDANRLRSQVSECFERAALPSTTEEVPVQPCCARTQRVVAHCISQTAPHSRVISVSPMTQERRRLLSFVVVGGGPTGVEVAAELYDMVHEDLRKLYPELVPDVRIRIIELQSHLLSTYDRAISNYTKRVFDRWVDGCCPLD